MMKRLVITILVGCTLSSVAQIPNAGFESWDSSRCAQGPYVPVSWQSECSFPLGFFSGLEQSADAYNGSYAAKLIPSAYGDFVFYNGPTFLYTSFSLATFTSSLNGYYKYSTDSLGDSASASVIIFEFDQLNSRYDTFFSAILNLGPASVYTPFSLSIPQLASGSWQDSMSITFLSDPLEPSRSPFYLYTGVLYVDDVWLDFANAIPEYRNSMRFAIYPNPSAGMATLEMHQTLFKQLKRVDIYNLQGKLLKQYLPENFGRPFTLNIADLPRGVYFITITADGEQMTERLIKI